MSNEYIKMIEERLLEMREKAKTLSPAQKKHLDKDDDGDIDSKDFDMLRKKKSESAEKMTPCPKCEGSMENHDPECPSHPDNKGGDSKEEGCDDYDKKKMKKEEVEQVDELKNSTVKSYVTKATKDRNVNKAHGMSHADSSQTFNNFGDGKKSDSELKKANKRFAKADKRQSGLDRAKKRYNEDAEQVVSEQWGFGEVIETTENGLNVYFEHGVEFNVPAEELTFVQESADRAKHYKGATKPETMLDKYKGAGAKKMATDNNVDSPKEAEITPEEEGHQDAVKAGKVTKQAPTRGGEPRKGDLKIVNPVKENYRTLATKGMGAETKKSINVGRQVDYFHPSNGDKKQGTITKIHATGYHVKDDNDGKTHKFDFHDRAKAKGLL